MYSRTRLSMLPNSQAVSVASATAVRPAGVAVLTERHERHVHHFAARGHFAHPERLALAGRDVAVLRDARLRQRIGGFARVSIERAQRRRALADLSFGTDEKEGSDADRDQGHRADCQSQPT